MATTVLVIEDDPRSIKLMELILDSKGYNCLLAQTGQEGLDLARTHTVDAIVLDLMLPEIDGLEVLRRLRDDPDLAKVPVVITSARARPTTKEEARQLGADRYLTKPYRKAELLEVIASLLDRDSRVS